MWFSFVESRPFPIPDVCTERSALRVYWIGDLTLSGAMLEGDGSLKRELEIWRHVEGVNEGVLADGEAEIERGRESSMTNALRGERADK